MRHRGTHPIQHAIQHAIHHALHHGSHPRGHRVVLHPRLALARHAADGATFEDLEQRTLMSAVPHLDDIVRLEAAANNRGAVALAAVKQAVPVAPVTPSGPVAIADPTLTTGGYVYKSFASDPLFGPSGPSINDVSQGVVGDCYLLSVLSSVARTDAPLVRQLITANSNDTYTVTFAGKKTVTVDAELPTLPDGQPAYAQLGSGNSLWVALVEKAYADYVNPKADSYTTISGGWMGDAFTAIGLKSTSTFSAASSTALATLLQKDVKANDFVTMGTASYVGLNTPLVAGHAYEIDSVTVNKQGAVTSVTLRNPWGNDVANGGYVTVTAQQVFNAFAGLSVSHA